MHEIKWIIHLYSFFIIQGINIFMMTFLKDLKIINAKI